MAFFQSAVGTLQTLVIALGAGLGIWGAINLMEGYGNDNPGAKSQGMKQLMAGGGVALIGTTLVPLLSGLLLRDRVAGSRRHNNDINAHNGMMNTVLGIPGPRADMNCAGEEYSEHSDLFGCRQA